MFKMIARALKLVKGVGLISSARICFYRISALRRRLGTSMDHNENAEWGPPLYAGAGVPMEPNTTGDPFYKMSCDLRFAVESLQMAPPTAVAYYDPPDGQPLRLIVNFRKARELTLWAVLLQDEAKPRILEGGERVFITNMPGVLGKTMNEVLAECQTSTPPSKSKTP